MARVPIDTPPRSSSSTRSPPRTRPTPSAPIRSPTWAECIARKNRAARWLTVPAPYSVGDVEKPASPGRGQLSAAVLDRADNPLRQRNRFDEHVMPHAKTFASGAKELNCGSGQANQTTPGNRPAVSASSARTSRPSPRWGAWWYMGRPRIRPVLLRRAQYTCTANLSRTRPGRYGKGALEVCQLQLGGGSTRGDDGSSSQ